MRKKYIVNMYIAIPRLRDCLVIGVLFSSLLLLTFYLSQPASAVVSTSTSGQGFNYYSNDNLRVYIEFPANWTPKEADTLLLSGNGAQLEIFVTTPLPETTFPSMNTPVEQIANNIIEDDSNVPNLHLNSHYPVTINNQPAYQLNYSEDQQGEGLILIDAVLIKSGGYLYKLLYSVPESLYNQNLPIRDSMIASVSLGDSYTTNSQIESWVTSDCGVSVTDVCNVPNIQGTNPNLSTGIEIVNEDVNDDPSNSIQQQLEQQRLDAERQQQQLERERQNSITDNINDITSDDDIDPNGNVVNERR
jgi:hypothetical protein